MVNNSGGDVALGRVYLLIHWWANRRPSDNPSIHSAIRNLGRADKQKRKPDISSHMVKWLDIDMAISKLSSPEQEIVAQVCVGKQMYLPPTLGVKLKGLFQERGLLESIR